MTATPQCNITWQDIQALGADAPERIIAYGEAPQQVGELRLPRGPGPHPVIMLIHGGCWRNAYGIGHVQVLSRALTRHGYAVWTPEYRRIGDAGGGWPGTFLDIAASLSFIISLAADFPLRAAQVVVMGHSAGGHLALWLAGRSHLPGSSALASPTGPSLRGVVGLAAISDLAAYERVGNSCSQALPELLGGTSAEQPARWREADPAQAGRLDCPVHLIHGTLDAIVPPGLSESFRGGGVQLTRVEGAGHFDLISPLTTAFPVVVAALDSL
jgi:acetyl esterase/lipase